MSIFDRIHSQKITIINKGQDTKITPLEDERNKRKTPPSQIHEIISTVVNDGYVTAENSNYQVSFKLGEKKEFFLNKKDIQTISFDFSSYIGTLKEFNSQYREGIEGALGLLADYAKILDGSGQHVDLKQYFYTVNLIGRESRSGDNNYFTRISAYAIKGLESKEDKHKLLNRIAEESPDVAQKISEIANVRDYKNTSTIEI